MNAIPDPGNVRERLLKAVGALATSSATIQRRLYVAAVDLELRPADFDDDVARTRFTAIKDSLTTAFADTDEGHYEATTSAMSDDQAEAIAGLIFELHSMYHPLMD